MATLSEFTSEIRHRNVSKPNQFYVEIILPKIFMNGTAGFNGENQRLVSMFCHSASTPQLTISTDDNHIENGIRRKYAYDQDYQNLNLSFYADQNFDVKRFFDQWKHAIVPQRRSFRYPADYTAESLNIYILDSTGTATYRYEYKNVFPKSFNSIDLSYNPSMQPTSFSVDFVFEDVLYYSLKNSLVKYTSKPNIPIEIITESPNKEVNSIIKNRVDSVFPLN